MATVLNIQKIVDSTKRSLIKVVGTGGTDANVSLIVAANLSYALTTNNAALLSPGNTLFKKVLYKTSIKRIWGHGQMGSSNNVTLKWGGNSNSAIVTFGAGQFDYNFDAEGLSGAISIPDSANCTGDILFSSTAGATDAWTLFIDLKKDASSYSQGQLSSPQDFNYNSFGVHP